MDKEIEYRTEQCNTWTHAMLESNLTKRDAYKAYHNVLIPRIIYPLAATTTAENLSHVEFGTKRKIVREAILRLRNMIKRIVFPRRYIQATLVTIQRHRIQFFEHSFTLSSFA